MYVAICISHFKTTECNLYAAGSCTVFSHCIVSVVLYGWMYVNVEHEPKQIPINSVDMAIKFLNLESHIT